MSTYRFISAERASFPVSLLCQVLEVSKSGFYAWTTRAPSDRTLSDAWLSERIKEIHGGARGVYGARRVHAELRHAHGVRIGRKRVERLMGESGISGGHRDRLGIPDQTALVPTRREPRPLPAPSLMPPRVARAARSAPVHGA